MAETLITVDNVSKKFCRNLKRSLWFGLKDLGDEFAGSSHDVDGPLRKDEFWALKAANFKLEKGECLGLIGRNGAGKTTLLRMLNGLIRPDRGKIEICGRVGALIALGAGFNPILTGRENIFVNASVMGLSKKEIDAKFEQIVEFAELGEFIDAPVQNYSSGMAVRLGFAVATTLKPDVLLIDEVLAVGDFSFRQKCAEKINELRRNAAVIFVSHNMRDILMLCSKTIVLSHGEIVFCGEPKDAVEFYMQMLDDEDAQKTFQRPLKEAESKQDLRAGIYGETYHNEEKISDITHHWVDQSGKPVDMVEHGAAITLEFSFTLKQPVKNLIIGVPFFHRGEMITAVNTDSQGIEVTADPNGCVKGRLVVGSLVLNPGKYTNIFSIVDSKEFLYRDFITNLRVKQFPVSFGVFTPPHRWCFDV